MFGEFFSDLQASFISSHRRKWRYVSSPHLEIQRAKSLRDLHPQDHRTCLQSLPTEILEHIFRLVCSDGGQMAPRLALVSSDINALSRAARFQSVSLISGCVGQINAFLEYLANERSAARAAGSTVPHVRHLRLSLVYFLEARVTEPGIEESLANSAFAACRPNAIRRFLGRTPDDPTKEAWRRKSARLYHEAVERLLQVIAPQVETLCLFGHGSTHRSEFYRLGYDRIIPGSYRTNGFPRLRELYLSGDAPHLVRFDQTETPTASPVPLSQAMFPALKRLHICAYATSKVNVRHWVAAAPVLEDFRITFGRWDTAKTGPELELVASLLWVLENRGTRDFPANPIVRIASMATRAPTIDVNPRRPLSEEEAAGEVVLDEIERHIRNDTHEPAILVRNYGMQDMHGGFEALCSYVKWRMRDSMKVVVETEWLGRLESGTESQSWTFRDACWYVPFDWKLPIEGRERVHDTCAVCIKNFGNESG